MGIRKRKGELVDICAKKSNITKKVSGDDSLALIVPELYVELITKMHGE